MFAGTRFGILSIIVVMTTFIILPTMSQEAQNKMCPCRRTKAHWPKNVAECEKEMECFKSTPNCVEFRDSNSCAYNAIRTQCVNNMEKIWEENHGGESKLRSKNDTSSEFKENYLCEDLNDENEDTKKFFKDVEGCKPMYDGALRMCEKYKKSSNKINLENPLLENFVLGPNSSDGGSKDEDTKSGAFQSIYSAIAIMTAYLMI